MTPEEIVERAAEVLDHHSIGAFNYAQSACDGCGVWMKHAEYRRHLAEKLAADGVLPTEVEWGAEGETPEPWAADLDERTRDEAGRYVQRFGGHVVQRLVTPWREVTS